MHACNATLKTSLSEHTTDVFSRSHVDSTAYIVQSDKSQTGLFFILFHMFSGYLTLKVNNNFLTISYRNYSIHQHQYVVGTTS